MSWRMTAGLLVILVALLAYVLLQPSEPEEQSEPLPTPTLDVATLLRGVAINDVVRLEVRTYDSSEGLVWERLGDGEWRQTVPPAGTVVSETLSTGLSGLLAGRPDAVLPPDANPRQAYGLDVPDYTVVVAAQRVEKVVRYTLEIGHETPTGDGYYVQRTGDDRIYVLSRSAVDRVLSLYAEPPEPIEADGS